MQDSSRTLITPSARLSRHLRRLHDIRQHKAGKAVWDAPDILPLNGWLTRSWGELALRDPQNMPVLLDSAQEELLWEEAIRTARRDDALLNVRQTAAVAANAWDLLHQWEAPKSAADFDGLEDTEAFFQWMTSVQTRLRDSGWITASQLPAALTELASELKHSVDLAGFDEPAPAERRLFAKLRAGQRPLAFVENYQVTRVLLHDQSEEWFRAACWTKERLASNPSCRIGVAIPGIRTVAATVERIFDDVLHPSYSFVPPAMRPAFELSAGRTFSEEPLVSAALLILGLTDQLNLKEAMVLLRSPFVGIPGESRVKVDQELRHQGVERVSVYSTSFKMLFPGLIREADAVPKRQSPLQWSSAFSKFLKAAGWGNGEKLTEEQHHVLRQWKDLLSQFARLGNVIPMLTLRQAIERIRLLAASEVVRLPDQDSPIQILDTSELPGMRFDALWVCGLDASNWPRPVRTNPFLPVRMQKQLGMPRSAPELEFEIAQRWTEQWKQSAKEVVFSSSAQTKEERRVVSPLIADIPESKHVISGWRAMDAVFTMTGVMEERPSDQVASLSRDIVHRGGMKILENQAACPFKAFAIQRLGAKEMGEAPFGVSAIEHGSAAHKALDQIWNELKTKTNLLSKTDHELEAIVEVAVDAALQKEFALREKAAGIERFRRLERARLVRIILNWLEHEKKRSPFTVVQHEEQEEVAIGGMRLHVRADRVDEFEDGTRAILDYKTGNQVNKKSWLNERLTAPQLPLYAVTHETGRVAQIAFAKLTADETKLIPLEVDEGRLAEWRRILEKLAEEYLMGRADVDPVAPETCKLCHLGPVCRVAERTGNTSDEGNEEGSNE